ncbi:uncharacterized protein METZ01_LOCUS211906, partial [marine metagenome]
MNENGRPLFRASKAGLWGRERLFVGAWLGWCAFFRPKEHLHRLAKLGHALGPDVGTEPAGV